MDKEKELKILLLLLLAVVISHLAADFWWHHKSALADAGHATQVDDSITPSLSRLDSAIADVPTVDSTNIFKASQLWRRAQVILESTQLEPELASRHAELTSKVETLRRAIMSQLPRMLSAEHTNAIACAKLDAALECWAKAGALLSLLPDTGDPSEAKAAQKFAYEHEQVRQQVLAKYQLAYNLWACGEVTKAWADIKEENRALTHGGDPFFTQTYIRFLAPVDATLLGLETGQIYKDVLEFMHDKMTKEDFQKMVKENSTVKKKGLSDV